MLKPIQDLKHTPQISLQLQLWAALQNSAQGRHLTTACCYTAGACWWCFKGSDSTRRERVNPTCTQTSRPFPLSLLLFHGICGGKAVSFKQRSELSPPLVAGGNQSIKLVVFDALLLQSVGAATGGSAHNSGVKYLCWKHGRAGDRRSWGTAIIPSLIVLFEWNEKPHLGNPSNTMY